jgi:hypothetical protein
MDEREDDELIAILDDEDEAASPAPRRRPWIWAAAAGGLAAGVLLSVLGVVALRPGPRPAAPAPLAVAVTPIAFAEEKPEPPPPPPVETPPVVQPPPPPALPQPPLVAAPPGPPAIPEPLERELQAAARAISDADPLFQEAMSQIDRGDPRRVAAQLATVEDLLQMARDVYARLRDLVPNRSTLDFRMAVVDVHLEALKEAQARLRARPKKRR